MSASPDRVIRIAIVEDDSRIRAVLKEVISSAVDCECVGLFSTGKAAIKNLPGLKPDVLLMDINLPDLSGVECVTQLSPLLPESQILMLTVYQDTDTIFQALSAGAHGYLVKPVMPDRLIEAIHEVRAGGVPMSRTIARKVIDVFHRQTPAPAKAPLAPSIATSEASLGPREQQVLDFLVAGLAYKEIAAELGIGLSTVGTYVQRIYEKLHVRTRREVIARCGTADGAVS
jgi:DNA-binding NarL/FixJ family response regulator